MQVGTATMMDGPNKGHTVVQHAYEVPAAYRLPAPCNVKVECHLYADPLDKYINGPPMSTMDYRHVRAYSIGESKTCQHMYALHPDRFVPLIATRNISPSDFDRDCARQKILDMSRQLWQAVLDRSDGDMTLPHGWAWQIHDISPRIGETLCEDRILLVIQPMNISEKPHPRYIADLLERITTYAKKRQAYGYQLLEINDEKETTE